MSDKVLRFGIPKGSLEAQTLELLRKSGWRISVDARSYMPKVDDPTLSCRLLRPQEMPRYIADGSLDAGITGRDWVVENDVDLVEVESFTYSKVSLAPTRWVVVVPEALAGAPAGGSRRQTRCDRDGQLHAADIRTAEN